MSAEPAVDLVGLVGRALGARPPRVLASGASAVKRWLDGWLLATGPGRAAHLVFGVWHDAPGQLEAFRRLVGPQGLALTDVVVEQFDGDGAWRDLAPDLQRGDSAALRTYLRHGDAASLTTLAQRQQQQDYTAWKYGYLDGVMDLVVGARARNLPLHGCDMPRPMQRMLVQARVGDFVDRLRELHCVLAVRGAARGSWRRLRAAWVFGQAHLRHDALPRFLPPSARVLAVYVIGGRPAGLPTIEQRLARHVGVLEVTLVALEAQQGIERVALLLPAADLGVSIERARSDEGGTAGVAVQVLGKDRKPSTLWLGASGQNALSRVVVGRQHIILAATEHWFAWQGPRLILGALELSAARPRAELELGSATVRVTYH